MATARLSCDKVEWPVMRYGAVPSPPCANPGRRRTWAARAAPSTAPLFPVASAAGTVHFPHGNSSEPTLFPVTGRGPSPAQLPCGGRTADQGSGLWRLGIARNRRPFAWSFPKRPVAEPCPDWIHPGPRSCSIHRHRTQGDPGKARRWLCREASAISGWRLPVPRSDGTPLPSERSSFSLFHLSGPFVIPGAAAETRRASPPPPCREAERRPPPALSRQCRRGRFQHFPMGPELVNASALTALLSGP